MPQTLRCRCTAVMALLFVALCVGVAFGTAGAKVAALVASASAPSAPEHHHWDAAG